MFTSIDAMKSHGFHGFHTVGELISNTDLIPDQKGVYCVLRTNDAPPEFLERGSGGFFKGKDPNVSLSELKDNWISGTPVVYIGKAGSLSGGANLRKRISQYLKFGQGKDIGHYGGRLIWQLKDAQDLLFCWKPTPSIDPAVIETEMINTFRDVYGDRPFANLVG